MEKKSREIKDVEDLILPKWLTYATTSKFKSIRRSIKRGHVDLFNGADNTSRPFNNRKDTIGRKHNQLKKRVYEQFKRI